MSQCKQCGVEIFFGDRFCHACGAEIEGNVTTRDDMLAKNPQELGKISENVAKLDSKIKKRTRLIIFLISVPVFIGFLGLILKLFFGFSVISLISFASFPNKEIENTRIVEEKDNVTSVGPTLTAFALENAGDNTGEGTVETAEPSLEELAPAPTLLFSEDFDGNTTSAVTLFSDEYMSFSTISGQGFLTSGYGPGLLPIVFPDFSSADFIAEFDCMAPEAYEDTNFGFIFRADETIEDGLDRYYALYIFPQQNAFRMGLFIDDEWYRTDFAQFEVPINTGYAMNHVRLEVMGSQMNLYVNGEFVSGFSEDTNMEAGLMGFFISPSASLPEDTIDLVIFDNFQVYQP